MFKKRAALLLGLALTASVALSGCTNNLPLDYTAFPKGGDGTGVDTPETVSGGLKIGLAVDSDAVGSAQGMAVINTYVAAVLTDQNGAITDCKLDMVTNSIELGPDGKLTQDKKTTTFASVRELGDSGWVSGADALAGSAVGKSAADAGSLAAEAGYEAFPALIAKAAGNAQNRGAMEGDKLGVGILGTMKDSMNARDSMEGKAVAFNSYAAASFDASGKVTSVYLDGSDDAVLFDVTGTPTTGELEVVPFVTKMEEGDEYGMLTYSNIGREYYQQALEYAAYATGKTVDELNGIAVGEEGEPSGVADLAASVSINVTDFNHAVTQAYASAG